MTAVTTQVALTDAKMDIFPLCLKPRFAPRQNATGCFTPAQLKDRIVLIKGGNAEMNHKELTGGNRAVINERFVLLE